MFRDLFIHQLKQAVRHRSWEKQVATNIFLGILFSLIILNILALGLAIEDILKTFFPDKNPVVQFTSFILYYVFADFILRLMLQEVPALLIRPYLTLPVRKNKLIHYLLSKSLLSFFPIIPLLVVIPFSIKILTEYYSWINITIWVIGVFIFFNILSYVALFLKRKIHFNPGIIAILILCFTVIILLEREGIVSISLISTILFMTPLENPLYSFIFLILFTAVYCLNFQYLNRHAYSEEMLAKQSFSRRQANYEFLRKMGAFGELVAMELRLIFRNRRTRSTVYLSLWMIALAWPFYKYYYPYLEKKPKIANYTQSDTPVSGIGQYKVTIHVIPATPPPLNQVCVAGNHEKFGEWKPDLVPLQLNDDSSWTRSFIFEKGTELSYKITGADWGNEALYKEGKIPDPFNLTVTQDTIITIPVAAWKEDNVFNMISGAMLIYAGVFFLGMFIITYGQFLFAWEAGYFDFLLAKKIDYRKYLLAKVFLLAATCLGAFLLVAPFLFNNPLAIYSLTVALLYDLGINLPLMLFLSLYNRTKIDIAAGAFSMQGKSGQQMLNVLILILAPAILSAILINNYGIMVCFEVLGGFGLSGIILLPFTFNFIYKRFLSKKYIMGAAFRQTI
jgi:hypothetical protein